MDPTTLFTTLRPRLQRIACRRLGSVAEAEDVVQEALLVRTVTRLCLDVLKSDRIKRQDYIGPWLPEPFIAPGGDDTDDITQPLMFATIVGQDKVARLLQALANKAGWAKAQVLCETRIDGLPGHVSMENDALLQAIAVEIDGGKITGIYVTRNPGKLAHLDRAALQKISGA